jgi:hypothetical protein
MHMPGFSADASLYRSSRHYRMGGDFDQTGVLALQQLKFYRLNAVASTDSGAPRLEPYSDGRKMVWSDLIGILWSRLNSWHAAGRPAPSVSLCSGICARIPCTPANPCTSDLITYTTGFRCAKEGAVCDPGYFHDCTCQTNIDWQAGAPYCACSW